MIFIQCGSKIIVFSVIGGGFLWSATCIMFTYCSCLSSSGSCSGSRSILVPYNLRYRHVTVSMAVLPTARNWYQRLQMKWQSCDALSHSIWRNISVFEPHRRIGTSLWRPLPIATHGTLSTGIRHKFMLEATWNKLIAPDRTVNRTETSGHQDIQRTRHVSIIYRPYTRSDVLWELRWHLKTTKSCPPLAWFEHMQKPPSASRIWDFKQTSHLLVSRPFFILMKVLWNYLHQRPPAKMFTARAYCESSRVYFFKCGDIEPEIPGMRFVWLMYVHFVSCSVQFDALGCCSIHHSKMAMRSFIIFLLVLIFTIEVPYRYNWYCLDRVSSVRPQDKVKGCYIFYILPDIR